MIDKLEVRSQKLEANMVHRPATEDTGFRDNLHGGTH